MERLQITVDVRRHDGHTTLHSGDHTLIPCRESIPLAHLACSLEDGDQMHVDVEFIIDDESGYGNVWVKGATDADVAFTWPTSIGALWFLEAAVVDELAIRDDRSERRAEAVRAVAA